MNKTKVHLLWYICILVRSILFLLPLFYNYLRKKNFKNKIVNIISIINKYIILFIGFGFLYKYIFGSNDEVQIAKVFWHNTRIIQSFLFIYAGIYFNNYNLSAIILFSSVLFSVTYRLSMGHFLK